MSEFSIPRGCTDPQPARSFGHTGNLQQLLQFTGGPVWDGNLIGKQARDELVDAGLVGRSRGWNFLTGEGVSLLVTLGFLRA